MLQCKEGAWHGLAGDTRVTFADMDKAYLASLRMAATIVETFAGSELPAGHSQRVFARMNEGICRIIEGRREIVSAVGHLQAIQARSNVAEVALGCPLPWPLLASAGTEEADRPMAPVGAA